MDKTIRNLERQKSTFNLALTTDQVYVSKFTSVQMLSPQELVNMSYTHPRDSHILMFYEGNYLRLLIEV